MLLLISRLGCSAHGLLGPGDSVEHLYYICLCKIPGSRIIQAFRPSVLNLYLSKPLNPQLCALFNTKDSGFVFPVIIVHVNGLNRELRTQISSQRKVF